MNLFMLLLKKLILRAAIASLVMLKNVLQYVLQYVPYLIVAICLLGLAHWAFTVYKPPEVISDHQVSWPEGVTTMNMRVRLSGEARIVGDMTPELAAQNCGNSTIHYSWYGKDEVFLVQCKDIREQKWFSGILIPPLEALQPGESRKVIEVNQEGLTVLAYQPEKWVVMKWLAFVLLFVGLFAGMFPLFGFGDTKEAT